MRNRRESGHVLHDPFHDHVRRRRRAPDRLDPAHGELLIYYSMSLSADGYINEPDGTFDWGAPSDEQHRFHNRQIAETGAQLLGRRLYETMLVWETEEFSDPTMAEFAELWRPLEKVVFSTTLTSVQGNARLATRSLEEEIAALGDRTIGVGGAGLAAACMRRGLIDEFALFVNPVVVGGGTPYFPPDVHLALELVETRLFGSTMHLRYRRV
jgi:dihydrofolate reductase